MAVLNMKGGRVTLSDTLPHKKLLALFVLLDYLALYGEGIHRADLLFSKPQSST